MLTNKQLLKIEELPLEEHEQIIDVIFDCRGICMYEEYRKITSYNKSRQYFYKELKSGKIKGKKIAGHWFAYINA